jgi:hypothetical protein
MKTTCARFLFVLPFIVCSARADLIGQFNFNSTVSDGSTSTGTNSPSKGTGTATLIGGATASYVGGATADPAPSDNSAWSVTKFPGPATANKSGGVEFRVSTLGFENIVVSWYQENSGTSSRYARFQYSTDGETFADADVIAIYADGKYTNKVVNLGAIPGVTNNPWFAFRIVSEFESTAVGSGAETYVATKDGSTYGTGGTIHFDMVTVSGTPFYDGNTPPYIFSEIGDQFVRANRTNPPLPFLVLDAEEPATNLFLSGSSSAPSIIPGSKITFGGRGANRTVIVAAGASVGSALVTICAKDSGGKSNTTSFNVTVLPANSPPVITDIPRTNTLANSTVGPIAFTVYDEETPAVSLGVSGFSANPVLLPNSTAHIGLGGSASNRTVTLTPAAGQLGVAPVTVTVTDGNSSSSARFPLMVTPSPAVVFYDPFSYADGSLVTNSAFLWQNRSGTDGECQVVNGQLQLTRSQTEDVVGGLIGGPYNPSNGVVLYASFKLKLLSLPPNVPGYFAHFANGSTLRGRVYVGTTNAIPGRYRLFVANGTDSPVMLPSDLYTNLTYTVVTRYNIDTATTALWLNPAGETDAAVLGTDLQTPARVSSFGFRQDTGIGATMLVDDLKVGLSFAAVAGTGDGPMAIPLFFQSTSGHLMFNWDDPAFALQAAPVAQGPYTNIPGAASPWSVPSTGAQRFFRLRAN